MTEIEIPHELPLILRNFTLSVLRSKPHDIIDYAVDYFTQLQQEQQQQQQQQQQSPLMTGDNIITTVPRSSTCSHKGEEEESSSSKQQTVKFNVKRSENGTNSIHSEAMTNMNNRLSSTSSNGSEEDDVVNLEENLRSYYVKKNEYRRISVAAERYNPEEDDDSIEEQSQIYSKTPEQRERLREAVSHNLLFRTLEGKQIDQILDAMWEKHVHQGEYIIQQGDDGDHFYVIDQGTYEVYVAKENEEPMKIGEYNQSGSFGELALMYNQPRSATILATSDGILWVMGRQTFRKLILKHAFRKRRLYEKFLEDLDILQSLTDYERSNVADALMPVDYYQHDVIIKQGDQGDRMFFIEDGLCDIYMNDKFHKRLHKGDYFGELALLNHEPRSATVIAASSKVRLASLEVESFERLLGPCMDLMQRNTSKYIK